MAPRRSRVGTQARKAGLGDGHQTCALEIRARKSFSPTAAKPLAGAGARFLGNIFGDPVEWEGAMDTTFPRKRGRPRNPPPTSPIIATTLRSRVTRHLPMSAPTVHELELYIAWASDALRISKTDALQMFIDRAVVDLLRKDRLWQQEKARVATGRGAATGALAPAIEET